MLPEGLLLGSTEQYFQSFEAGPFMGAAPSALIPGQGDDQGRNCLPPPQRPALCNPGYWEGSVVKPQSNKVLLYRVAQTIRLPCSL